MRYRWLDITGIAVLAFLAHAGGATGSARADGVAIHIDCHGTNGVPDWAASNTPIRIILHLYNGYGGEELDLGPDVIDPYFCSHEGGYTVWYYRITADEMYGVTVHADGSDALFIDTIRLTDLDTGNWWQSGVDNTVGYCVSTQPSDGNNNHCRFNEARQEWFFPIER